MQIIDELEVNKRGPYGGGMGYVAYNGNMDIALALRTMVISNPPPSSPPASNGNTGNPKGRKTWTVHLQVCTVSDLVALSGDEVVSVTVWTICLVGTVAH